MENSLGDNLARRRRAAGLSQEELAAAAGVGVDTVGRLERGERQVTRPDTLARLATALRTTPGALLGLSAGRSATATAMATALRKAITTSSEMPGLDFADNSEVTDLPTLSTTAHRAWRNYVAGEHPELMQALPALLVDARRLVHATRNDEHAAAQRLLSVGYRLGAGLAGRLGLDDLAWHSAERAMSAARLSDSAELETATSARYAAWVLVRQGRMEEAGLVAVKAAERVEPRMLDRDPQRLGAFGNLLLNAASAAVRSGKEGQAADLLAVAQAAAVRAGADSASEAAIFGPRVAGLQAVDHAVRLGDPEQALRLAEAVPAARGLVPRFWESGHRLHLAHAAVQLRRDRLALRLLAEARDISPDWARRQPLGRTVMRSLIDRATRRQGGQFAALAAFFNSEF